MSEVKSAINFYREIKKKTSNKRYILEKNDVEQILELIEQELIVSNFSEMMDAAYSSCCICFFNHYIHVDKYKPMSFIISEFYGHKVMPPFNAWWIIILLSEHLMYGSIEYDIEMLKPYFFENHMLQNPDVNVFNKALHIIDKSVRAHRKKMYKLYVSGPNDSFAGVSSRGAASNTNRKQTEAPLEQLTAEVEKKKEDILAEARKQAEVERQKIINDSRQEADRIINRASFEAEQKISTARKKSVEITGDSQKQIVAAEQQLLQCGFSDVRSALVQANDMIKSLEDTVSESFIKKTSTQLLELFNLIADSKESTIDLARKNNDQALENVSYNLDVFLDMIIEYLAEYGIQPITSIPGDRFSPKNHTIGQCDQQFDPRCATIKVSKRTGFLWGEQVLQKERVEI